MTQLFLTFLLLFFVHLSSFAQNIELIDVKELYRDCKNRIYVDKKSNEQRFKKLKFSTDNGKITLDFDSQWLNLIPDTLGKAKIQIRKKRKMLLESTVDVLRVPNFRYSWTDTLGNPLFSENPIKFPGKIVIQFELDEKFKHQCPSDTLYKLLKVQVFQFRGGRAIATREYESHLLDLTNLQVQKGDAIQIKLIRVARVNFANENEYVKITTPYSSFQFE